MNLLLYSHEPKRDGETTGLLVGLGAKEEHSNSHIGLLKAFRRIHNWHEFVGVVWISKGNFKISLVVCPLFCTLKLEKSHTGTRFLLVISLGTVYELQNQKIYFNNVKQ